jgi:uncharacterized protein YbaR (Trm112 family)
MRLTQSHLDLLVCPVCHGALTLTDSAGAVGCLGCRREFPIVDGLPVLLASRSKQG